MTLMTYNDYETSPASGHPIECYKFVGTFTTYLYTSSDQPVTIGTDTYLPVPMERTKLAIGTHADNNQELTITLPTLLQMVIDYAFNVAPPDLTLTLYRFHTGAGPSSSLIFWTGEVSSIMVTGHSSQILVPSIFIRAMKNNIPAASYQSQCNHMLFDGRCKLSQAAYTFSSVVGAISGKNVELADDPGQPDAYYVSGQLFCPSINQYRLIMASSGTSMLVNYPFSGLVVGAAIEVMVGCDHSFATCGSKFANQLNYGGFPYVPNVNPFTYGV